MDNQLRNGCLMTYTFIERRSLVSVLPLRGSRIQTFRRSCSFSFHVYCQPLHFPQSKCCFVKAALPSILELLTTNFKYSRGSVNYGYVQSLRALILNIYSQKCVPQINEEVEVSAGASVCLPWLSLSTRLRLTHCVVGEKRKNILDWTRLWGDSGAVLPVVAGQAREFWDAVQRLPDRGAPESFRGALRLLGTGNEERRALGLEMPARVHGELWLHDRPVNRTIHRIFYRWKSPPFGTLVWWIKHFFGYLFT